MNEIVNATSINNNFYDSHLFPQYWFLDDLGLKITDIDYLINYKNFSSQMDNLLQDLNINKKVPKENISKLKYNFDINLFKKKIENLYKRDFELFL